MTDIPDDPVIKRRILRFAPPHVFSEVLNETGIPVSNWDVCKRCQGKGYLREHCPDCNGMGVHHDEGYVI